MPSGTAAFDWTVPAEWNIRDAYVKDDRRRACHRLRAARTSTSSATAHRSTSACPWTSCARTSTRCPTAPTRAVPHVVLRRVLGLLPRPRRPRRRSRTATTRSCVDTHARAGLAHVRRVLIPGASDDEVLLSTHVCHPSLANDNLSGHRAAHAPRRACSAPGRSRYSYRLLFIPGTIGSIVWLSRNEEAVGADRSRAGASPASATPAPSPTSAAGGATPTSTAPLRTCCGRPRGDAAGRRLLAVRLRRAPVLLPRLRPPGRAARPHAARRVSRVPHVGRRPRLRRSPSSSPTPAPPSPRSSTCSRATAAT